MQRGGPDITRRLITSLGLMSLTIVGGTIGYLAFGDDFIDALFQTVITVTTVGFGEVRRFSTGQEIFTIFLILFGVGTAAYALSVLIEFFIEGYFGGSFRRKKMERDIAAMHGHVILCGWGRVGKAIAHSLRSTDAQVVVVDNRAELVATVEGHSICGDATDEDVLRAAGIDRAGVLITALNADADNLYVTLTGRSMCPGLFIVSRAATDQAVGKLVQAGANRVVNPQELGGARMAALARAPHVADFLDVVMRGGSLDLRLEQIEIAAGSPLAGQTLSSCHLHDKTGTLVLAMREPGEQFRSNPPATAQINAGEVLIVIGDADQIDRLRAMAGD